MAGFSELDDREELIAAMFALLTARLEGSATIAANSQNRRQNAKLRTNVETIRGLLAEANTLSAAINAILSIRSEREVECRL